VQPEPTDEELIDFARTLLRDLPPTLTDDESLRESVQAHRDHWVQLFLAARMLPG
jgi:hypothetical protein